MADEGFETVLITGTTGFLGGRLARTFRDSFRVIELNRRLRPEAQEPLVWDFRSESLPRLPARIGVLVHAAAAHGTDPDEDGRDCFAVNVFATRVLLSYARQAGAKLFVYLSTGSVYGLEREPSRETDPLRPQGAYACSKAAGEFLLRGYAGWLNTLCLRLFYPYGAGQQTPRLMPALIQRLVAGECIPLNGRDGEPRINPIYVDDCTAWVERLVRRCATGTYNLAGEEAVTVAELARRLGNLLGRKPRFECGNPLGGDRLGDATLVREATGIAPQWTLDRGLSVIANEASSGLGGRKHQNSAGKS